MFFRTIVIFDNLKHSVKVVHLVNVPKVNRTQYPRCSSSRCVDVLISQDLSDHKQIEQLYDQAVAALTELATKLKLPAVVELPVRCSSVSQSVSPIAEDGFAASVDKFCLVECGQQGREQSRWQQGD